MDKFTIGEAADAAEELEALLEYNGFPYTRNGGAFRLVFAQSGVKWEMSCICEGSRVLLYGRYPFPVQENEQTLHLCSEINRQVVQGGMFAAQGALIFRTGAELFDAYSAYEQLARAMEYNSAVIRKFWNEAAACAGEWGNGDYA